ncbi:MAG TPA: thymidylate synthase [Ignavibacteriales bacterium]|jgi:thymidylate synthase|nr:thymidylate synthase [Ignavibacteriales bacterium]
MKKYIDLLEKILDEGKWKDNRTGIKTLSISGAMFEHNMQDGFPLLTTKKMGLKNICAELEFFIKGLRSKKWLHERNCHIWDEWANPVVVDEKVKNIEKERNIKLTKEEILKIQFEEDDLGPVYGVIWRDWNQDGKIDQLKNVINKLKENPFDRRMIVSAWNPSFMHMQALPPCHYGFQILSDGEYIDLLWNQRSVDTFLGLPYNIASYAMLLLLIAKETNLKPGKLIGFLADVHIYENHLEQVKIQIEREPYPLPTVVIPDDIWDGIFNWQYTDFVLENYQHHAKLTGEVAV